MQQQIDDDILEPIELDSLNVEEHVWVPHRPVIKSENNVTTKLRVVLNCSLKIGDTPSLNEAAYSGVDLMNDLLQLLIKIRCMKYFVMSDIKQAFLRINLSETDDRNKFSILWRNREGRLVAYRYKTIVFGFVSSPFILHQVIKQHLTNYSSDACNHILSNNIYVDNLFLTGNSLQYLSSMYEETYRRLADGGFELRSWVSNATELQAQFRADGRAATHDCDYEKVLGYRYYTDKDKFKLAQFDEINLPITKRTILSCIAKQFDPLGFTLPVSVRGKILLSKLWQAKLDWDVPLGEFSNEWSKIYLDLQKLPNIEFPRQAADTEISLIICCDSSKLIYGFSCYAKSGSSVNLIFAKAKTAPIKSKSLPTLELLSVFLAIKCIPTILDSLANVTITDLTLCVDAQVVLSWILTGNVKAKNLFASNRIKDIKMLTDEIKASYNLKCVFKYLPTELNPADLLTRGLSFREFEQKLPYWQHGPQLFAQTPILWPDRNLGCLSSASKLLTCNAAVNGDTAIFPVNKFSSVNKLFRVTALVFKFISKLRKDGKDENILMQDAKLYWLKYEQRLHCQAEYQYLTNPISSNVPTTVKNLNLFLDSENVIRCKGRLDKSELSYDVRNPVLLPRFSFLTDLFVWDAHYRCLHMGTESTLNFLRKSGLWLPKGRARVKCVIRKCIICKKLNAHAFKYPKPTNLVANRVKFNKPFQYTGVDFTGHVYVKHNGSLIKMFILVFTCLNVRAIHLELLPSMSCHAFLMAFIRFCNLNEIPDAIYSDNASSFIAGMGIVAGSLIDNDFNAHLTKNNIRHIRIPLYSAWV